MIVLHSEVVAIKPVVQKIWISGTGSDAIFEEKQTGWKVQIGLIAYPVEGEARPNFNPGDKVAIIIVKE